MIFWSCREVSRQISQGSLEESGVGMKLQIYLHLLYCRHCRRFLREMKILAQAARLWADNLLDPQRERDFEERLIRQLKA